MCMPLELTTGVTLGGAWRPGGFRLAIASHSESWSWYSMEVSHPGACQDWPYLASEIWQNWACLDQALCFWGNKCLLLGPGRVGPGREHVSNFKASSWTAAANHKQQEHQEGTWIDLPASKSPNWITREKKNYSHYKAEFQHFLVCHSGRPYTIQIYLKNF